MTTLTPGAKTLTVALAREDIIRIIISRAVFSAQEAGHTIDLGAVTLGAFAWGPAMSGRITLPLAHSSAHSLARGAAPRVDAEALPPAPASGLAQATER